MLTIHGGRRRRVQAAVGCIKYFSINVPSYAIVNLPV